MFRFHAKLLVADLKQIGSNHPDFIENLFRQVSVLCLLMEKNNWSARQIYVNTRYSGHKKLFGVAE